MKIRFGERMKKNITVFTFIICMLVIGCLAVYYQYMKREQIQAEVHTPATETEKLIAKDLEMGYPETPTELMKLWGRLNQCLYNTSLSEEEIHSLLKQLRVMYSKELLQNNEEKKHLSNLEKEVSKFKEDKNKIVSYSTETAASVKYKTIKNQQYADIRISYFVTHTGNYSKIFQDFLLIKENDKWKILGFKSAQQEPVLEKEK